MGFFKSLIKGTVGAVTGFVSGGPVGAVVGGLAGVAGAAIAGKSAKDAAETQADSINDASAVSKAAADRARLDVLEAFDGTKDTVTLRNKTTGEKVESGKKLNGSSPEITGDANEDAIRAEYANQFGREPDAGGLAFWKSQLADPNSGVTLDSISSKIDDAGKDFETVPSGAAAILGAAAVNAQDVLAGGTADTISTLTTASGAAGDIISGAFDTARNDFLGSVARTADTGTTFLENTQTGGITQSGRLLGPNEQPILTNDRAENTIRNEYFKQFGREPDAEGLAYWKSQLADPNSGITGFNIAQEITNAGKRFVDVGTELAGTPGLNPALNELSGIPQQLTPFTELGTQAFRQQSALTGGLGVDAQQQAFDQFIESPGQAFFRQRQEESLLRNNAAVGGLGGGNVRTALQEQAFGIAAQQQQELFNNLGQISNTGFNAANSQSSLEQQLAISRSNLQSGGGTALSQLALGEGQAQAGLVSGLGADVANVQGQGAINNANLINQTGQNLSNIETQKGIALANIGVNAGTNQANLLQNLGATQAAGIIGQSNAIQQGVSGVATALGQAAGRNQTTQQQPQLIQQQPQQGLGQYYNSGIELNTNF